MKTTRQQQKENTRALILSSAIAQFSLQGVLATTTADIAKAAQVSHGNLFAHFATREALLVAVIDELGLLMGKRFQELAQHKRSLKSLLQTHIAILSESEALYSQLIISAPIMHAEARLAMFNIQSGIAHHISQTIQEEWGALPWPPHLIFNTWIGLIHHYLINRDFFAPGRLVLVEKGEELITFFIQLFKGAKNGNL